ncbi:MAG: class I cytochrome c [Sideroxydans sp.]|nr:class I cytochrome c [Sideroxydans sp.]
MTRNKIGVAGTLVVIACFLSVPAYAVDAADAQELLEKSKCLKCHDVEKTKKGKAYKKIAADYKSNPNAVAAITKHVTEPSQVKIEGEMVDHGVVKTRDKARIQNLVEWILSR